MEIKFSTSASANIPIRALQRALRASARTLRLPKNVEVSVTSVGDATMRKLNARYRGKDRVTDVLSFPQFEGKEILVQIRREAKRAPVVPLGDIYLHLPRLRQEASLYDRSSEQHIAAMTVHSFLHLLGYDHEHAGPARAMEAIEQRILSGRP